MYGGNSLLESKTHNDTTTIHNQGRFPANLIHDGSQEVLELFPESGDKSPARFFYCAKASKKDRDEGLEGEEKECGIKNDSGRGFSEGDPYKKVLKKNNHPTVKPTALMSYLCRLITPTGGVVLDPYMGSGSTGKAAVREGFSFVGCELDPDYYEIAKERVTNEGEVNWTLY
jgi:DNA modification methylase